jgi:L-threonylcarbamoyladenylate synthase
LPIKAIHYRKILLIASPGAVTLELEKKLTQIIRVNHKRFTLRQLEPAVEVLLGGGVVGAATESFYSLMVLADRSQALERLKSLKGDRDEDQAFLLLVDSRQRVMAYAQELPIEAELLMDKFWPGLLTILLKAQSGLHPLILGSNKSTVGLRLDRFPLTGALVRMADRAVTGTSANPHGKEPPKDAQGLLDYYTDLVDLVVDSGPAKGKKPSTVIDISKVPFSILREGAVSTKEVLKVLPNFPQ